MKATELRIGNWIMTTPNNKFQVTPDEYKNWDVNGMWANPIPLTEEWLVKFGFEKGKKGIYQLCSFDMEHTMWILDNGVSDLHGQVVHVHQLQNLYFAITGEELIIKETLNIKMNDKI